MTGTISWLFTHSPPIMHLTQALRTAARSNYPGHVPLTTAQNALLAVGSGVMGVLDTSRGGESTLEVATVAVSSSLIADLIATLSESTATTFLPSLHEAMIAHPEGRQIMRDQPSIASDVHDKLRHLKRGTLGREWVEWCERGNVTPDTRAAVSLPRRTVTSLITPGPLHRLAHARIHDVAIPPNARPIPHPLLPSANTTS